MSENKSVGSIFMHFWAQKKTAKEHQLRAIIGNLHSYLKMLQMFEYITWQKDLHNLYIN